MKSNITHEYLLAVGVLTWCGSERRSDRYGSVMILDPDAPHDHDAQLRGATAPYLPFTVDSKLVNVPGALAVEVVEVRESEHIGDLFRNIRPGGAVVGETLVLGHGTLFRAGKNSVGIKPAEDRESDWLAPKLLYRAHECVVRLTFTPDVPL